MGEGTLALAVVRGKNAFPQHRDTGSKGPSLSQDDKLIFVVGKFRCYFAVSVAPE